MVKNNTLSLQRLVEKVNNLSAAPEICTIKTVERKSAGPDGPVYSYEPSEICYIDENFNFQSITLTEPSTISVLKNSIVLIRSLNHLTVPVITSGIYETIENFADAETDMLVRKLIYIKTDLIIS